MPHLPKMIGPWTQVSVQSVYRNAWIHLEHHEVLRPDGKKGVYGVVHFVHHALGVVALDETGWIWLVGQHRYPLDIYSWEIPEGGEALMKRTCRAFSASYVKKPASKLHSGSI